MDIDNNGGGKCRLMTDLKRNEGIPISSTLEDEVLRQSDCSNMIRL